MNTSASSAAIITRHCRRLSDPQLRQCPECGRKSLKRLVSAVRFRLAGSGWYETDFKSDKEAKRNLHEKGEKEEAKTDGAGTADGAAKPDVKEAAKPESKPDATKAASPEPAGRSKRTVVTRPAAASARSKANGKTQASPHCSCCASPTALRSA